MKTKNIGEALYKTAVDIQEKLSDDKEVNVITTNHIKYCPKSPFVILFQNEFFLTIEQYKLTQTDLRVMFRILYYISYGNCINLERKILCKDLNIDKSRLSRSFKNLHDCGLLITTEAGTFLNPQIIVKGSLKNFTKEEQQKLTELGAKILMEKIKSGPTIETEKMMKERKEREDRLKDRLKDQGY